MASPIDPWMTTGLAETIQAHTASVNDQEAAARVSKLQADLAAAESTARMPAPTPNNQTKGGLIGGGIGLLLGALAGSLSPAGVGMGALQGMAGGRESGRQAGLEANADVLGEYKNRVESANAVIEDRQKLASGMRMLMQSGQGGIFEGMDPAVLGELAFPGSGLELQVEKNNTELIGKDSWRQIQTLKALLPYQSREAQMVTLSRISRLTGKDPNEMFPEGISSIKMPGQMTAAQADDRYLNGVALYQESISTGRPMDITRGIPRPRDYKTVDQMALAGLNKWDEFLALENSQGRFPDPLTVVSEAMSPAEEMAFRRAFDGQDGRPSEGQMLNAYRQIVAQGGVLLQMEQGLFGADMESRLIRNVNDMYEVLRQQNLALRNRDYANRYQEFYMQSQSDNPDWSPEQHDTFVRGKLKGNKVPKGQAGTSLPPAKGAVVNPPKSQPKLEAKPGRILPPGTKTRAQLQADARKRAEAEEAKSKAKPK